MTLILTWTGSNFLLEYNPFETNSTSFKLKQVFFVFLNLFLFSTMQQPVLVGTSDNWDHNKRKPVEHVGNFKVYERVCVYVFCSVLLDTEKIW